MKPSIAKQIKALNIVIYAQNGILAGDLAALLSGHNTVDRQTSLLGVLNSLKSPTDILLLVGGREQVNSSDPKPILLAAKKARCKVIVLGEWLAFKNIQSDINSFGPFVTLSEIPSPTVLFKLIADSKAISG